MKDYGGNSQSDAKCLQSYTRCITQAFASNRRTPTSYAYTRIRSCKRIGHQYEYTQSHRVINCAFEQTNTFYLFVCLLLVYSFSPRAQSIQRGPLDNAAMFFYAAIVLCASTRQNGKSDLVGLLGIVQIEDKQQIDAKCLQS